MGTNSATSDQMLLTDMDNRQTEPSKKNNKCQLLYTYGCTY